MQKLSDNYRTPPSLFEALNEVTPFFWDACCTKDNCLVEHQKYQMNHSIYGSNPHDYLTLDLQRIQEDYDEIFFNCYSDYRANRWNTIFINPPYSNVKPFIEKAWEDAKHFRVVMLLKADMSTDWFNDLIKKESLSPIMKLQREATLKNAYTNLLKEMNAYICGCCKNRICRNGILKRHIGILHLRKRVKFLADEEMMEADLYMHPHYHDSGGGSTPWKYVRKGNESKNFKRGADGLIYPKSGPTFPSMIIVLDRRAE